jgi:hypothetical protein
MALYRFEYSPAALFGEAQPARAELLAEHAILGLEIVDHLALVLVDPAGQGDHEKLERRHKRRVSEGRRSVIRVASGTPRPRGRAEAAWDAWIELLDRDGMIIGRFAHVAQLLEDIAGSSAAMRSSASVKRTRLGKCRVSVETARLILRARCARNNLHIFCPGSLVPVRAIRKGAT